MTQYITGLHHYWSGLLSDLAQLPFLEGVAACFALLYLVLALRQSQLCWYAAFISTSLYMVVFWDSALLMESALQLYYLAMAAYGWWQWSKPSPAGGTLLISRWPLSKHVTAIGLIVVLTFISGNFLTTHTGAALPYLDSFTSWGAVVTTYMVTKKIFENWIYWLVFDGVSIYLYLDRGLMLTAALFVVYIVIVIFGLVAWYRELQRQGSLVAEPG